MRVARLSVIIALCAGLGLVAPGSAAAAPGPPMAPEWWFDAWNVPALWAAGARGQDVTIAEIDTGVNAALPELAGKILPGKDFGGAAGDGRTDRDQDMFGHGTAMASIMVARPTLLDITGLAPDARVLPIAVPIQGTSDASVSDHVPDAIRWAANQHANPPESTLDFQGFNFWLNKLNEFNGNFVNAEMVKAFLVSGEYRHRFGP